MREIKFRAWNKYNMSYDELTVVGPDIGLNALLKNVQRNFTLMQYTGLKDRNGREIYEGDILKSRENDEVWRVDEMLPAHRQSHVTNIGYFCGKTYNSRASSAAYDNIDDWMSWPEMYEIVGNVYENPQLMAS